MGDREARGFAGLFRAFGRGIGRGSPGDREVAQVDAEITAFGEAVAELSFEPGHHADDSELLVEYERALDAYDRAKQAFANARSARDLGVVRPALDEGRYALACMDAIAQGRPKPAPHPPCFFDHRHGPSTSEVSWAPPEGAARIVAVCAADAVRLAEGLPPIRTGRPPRPTGQAPAPARPTVATAPTAPTAPTGPLNRRIDPERVLMPEPAPVPAPGTGTGRSTGRPSTKRPDPYGAWPDGIGEQQCRQGRGSRELNVLRLDPRAPALVVVHFGHPDQSSVELTGPTVPTVSNWRVFTAGMLPRVIIPVGPDGEDRLRFRVATSGRWRAWLHPLECVPVLRRSIESRGDYVFRHTGALTPLRVVQHDGYAFSLHRLDQHFAPGPALFQGDGRFAAAVVVEEPGLLYLRSKASWTISRG
jgi:hypothetical protein